MTVRKIFKAQFRAHAPDILQRIQATDESVILTNRGKPVIEIRKHRELQGYPLNVLRGSVLYYRNPTDLVGDNDWAKDQ